MFERGPRGTSLTAAGQAFWPHAERLVQGAGHAVAAAQEAALPGRIQVGYTTNLVATAALARLRSQFPNADVGTRHLAWDEPTAALIDRRVDAVLARLPLAIRGLAVTPLYREARVLMVSKKHRLSGRAKVTFDDIADEPLPVFPDPVWNAFWRVDPRPDGRPAPSGPLVERTADSNEWVASGECISFVPSSAVPHQVHPGCTTVPIDGVQPCQVVAVRRADDDSELVEAFVSAAVATLTDHSAT